MVNTENKRINGKIKKYLEVLRDNGIRISSAYLFGSYANNTFKLDSDIDIAVISDDFSGNRFDDKRVIVPLRRAIDNRIEPVPYRKEDFTNNDPLVIQILKTGRKIA